MALVCAVCNCKGSHTWSIWMLQCAAYQAPASAEKTWTMRATFPEYVVALATVVGSVLFTVCLSLVNSIVLRRDVLLYFWFKHIVVYGDWDCNMLSHVNEQLVCD